MPKVNLEKATVMQFESRPYKGKDGSDRTDRSMVVRFSGKLFSFKVEKELTDAEALAVVDKTVSLELAVSTFGADLTPTFRVAGVVKPK